MSELKRPSGFGQEPPAKRQASDVSGFLSNAALNMAAMAYQAQSDFQPGMACLKLLVSQTEMNALMDQDGATASEVQAAHNCQLARSEGVYPGCSLMELSIWGQSAQDVLDAATFCLTKALNTVGILCCGDQDQVRPEEVRARVVVPIKVARALIGVRGAAITQMRQETGMHVHVEHHQLPLGPSQDHCEQVVTLDGPGKGLNMALMTVMQHMMTVLQEEWYATWARSTNCGAEYPGLVLFERNAKGKGKSKGVEKGMEMMGGMKGMSSKGGCSGMWGPGEMSGMGGGGMGGMGGMGGKGGGMDSGGMCGKGGGGAAMAPVRIEPGHMAIKLLLSSNEASSILGKGGMQIRTLAQETGTSMHMSQRGSFYPGTVLQEMRITGPPEAALKGAQAVAVHVLQSLGAMTCGEEGLPPGAAKLRMVIPTMVCRIVIGKGGENITAMRAQTGMHVHIDKQCIPPGGQPEQTEQVLCLSGQLAGLPTALSMTAGYLAQCVSEAWFASWASWSNCGLEVPGVWMTLDGQGKGKGKEGKMGAMGAMGKGKDGMGAGMGGMAGMGKMGMGCKGDGKMAMSWGMDAQQGMGGGPIGAPQGCKGGGKGPAAVGDTSGELFMCIKLLLAQDEAGFVVGADGATLNETQAATGTQVQISNAPYPGTNGALHEVIICGMSKDTVITAVGQMVQQVMGGGGWMCSGEANVEPAGTRLKLVVPAKAAAAVIGHGGKGAKSIRENCGVRLNVDMNMIPAGGNVNEQAVLLTGNMPQVLSAIPLVVEQVAQIALQFGVQGWAQHSNAGVEIPGLTLFTGKGKGKGKGDDASKGGMAGMAGLVAMAGLAGLQ